MELTGNELTDVAARDLRVSGSSPWYVFRTI